MLRMLHAANNKQHLLQRCGSVCCITIAYILYTSFLLHSQAPGCPYTWVQGGQIITIMPPQLCAPGPPACPTANAVRVLVPLQFMYLIWICVASSRKHQAP